MSRDLLLDTHMLIWFAQGDDRARHLLASADDPATTVTMSVVSLMEIAIKRSVGKIDADVAAMHRLAVRHGMLELGVSGAHAETLERLPLHHRDPFDRLLAAQAISEGMTLVTSDRAFDPYEGLEIRGR